MTKDIWSRTSTNCPLISASLYNLIIGLTLCWGFGINYLIVTQIDPQAILNINEWVFFIGYFISCLVGIGLFTSSDKPIVSFTGYNLVVLPFGLILNLVISDYDSSLVSQAIMITGLVTVGMMCLGALFPSFFQSIIGTLSIALILVIIVELISYFVFNVHHDILDWIVVLIFCGYIGFDWGRANQIPKTVDNAIDSAAALYMDIINLFIRILRILARNKK